MGTNVSAVIYVSMMFVVTNIPKRVWTHKIGKQVSIFYSYKHDNKRL